MSLPSSATIIEVGPRDGLQNEVKTLEPDVRVELIERLASSGLRKIEAGSFVSPKWVPQMNHTDIVLTQLHRQDGIQFRLNNSPTEVDSAALPLSYTVLTPNLQGFESAVQYKADEVAIFGAASESFSKKNINCSIDESLKRFESVMSAAKRSNIPVRGYVSTVIGCPYEGDIEPSAVAQVAKTLFDMGCYEISLGDTIGVGTPKRFQSMLDAVLKEVPVNRIAVHCHNTYGQALANIYASLEMGIDKIDSAIAGLGGCPYAKGASGNIATEDVVYMLSGMGIETGIDLSSLVSTSQWICNILDRQNQSKVTMAIQ